MGHKDSSCKNGFWKWPSYGLDYAYNLSDTNNLAPFFITDPIYFGTDTAWEIDG